MTWTSDAADALLSLELGSVATGEKSPLLKFFGSSALISTGSTEALADKATEHSSASFARFEASFSTLTESCSIAIRFSSALGLTSSLLLLDVGPSTLLSSDLKSRGFGLWPSNGGYSAYLLK